MKHFKCNVFIHEYKLEKNALASSHVLRLSRKYARDSDILPIVPSMEPNHSHQLRNIIGHGLSFFENLGDETIDCAPVTSVFAKTL